MPKKEFFIPQIEEDEVYSSNTSTVEVEETPKKKYVSEGFVSSIYGKNVKDNAYFHGVKYGNGGRQYDSFRERDKRVDVDDFKQYIIQKEPDQIYQKKQEDNFYSSSVKQTQTPIQPAYQETINLDNNEDEDDIYYNEPIQKEEYVNVKPVYDNNGYSQQKPNPYYQQPQQNNYSNQNSYQPQYNNYQQPQQNNYSNQNNYQQPQYNSYQQQRQSYNNFNNSQINPYSRRNEEKINVVVEEEKPVRSYQKNTINEKPYEPTIKAKKKSKYVAPPLNVLKSKPKDLTIDDRDTNTQRDLIDLTLKQFDIGGHVVNYTKGPTVTQFEIKLDDGVRYQKVTSIQQNIQGNLKATSIRMQAPIPGKSTVGVEVPNIKRETVFFGDMISNKEFLNDGNPMNVVLGVNINGDNIYLDLSKMPHGLVAGSTGSGKSVCINAIIASILYKAHPDDVKLILVDPKRVEFARYSGIPHLASPIITEPKMANAALKWAVEEMENRYRLFEATGVTKYSEYLEETQRDARLKHIPYIVIIIDELADLMVTAGAEVEESIMRITQKARAAGMHLIVATQRPSVNIISGTIKSNIPTKIAFKVNKMIDSTVILDHPGAEKLLGLGDMLYTDDMGVENRIQGAFISSSEIKDVVNALESFSDSEYLFTEEDLKKKTMVDHSDDALQDELFEDIAKYVVENNTASINLLQKKFGCGFSRIQAIIIKLGELGVVSENLGSRAREVLVNISELNEILKNI